MVASIAAAIGCPSCKTSADNPRRVPPKRAAAPRSETASFLRVNRSRYERAIARARRWLDALEVDPIALRARGLKGKKKYVEKLDAYYTLYRYAHGAEKARLRKRLASLAAVTRDRRYHDMLEVDDRVFKQDATSYLRAAYLLDRAGVDVREYREQIAKVHGRLNRHMRKRGVHQRMVFHWYYDHFGLDEPFPLARAFHSGLIARQPSPYAYRSRLSVYNLTHEIYVPYRYGERLDADFFNDTQKRYLRRTLQRLTVRFLFARNADLVGELVCCLRFLRFSNLAVYREGLDYLLHAQRPNGSWGNYERQRAKIGDLVEQNLYLHTTGVVIDALTLTFENPD